MDDSRSYARARVAVAPGDSTSSLKKSATATRRSGREETRARATAGPEVLFPRPTTSEIDDLVREYQQTTGDGVRTNPKRNLLAACYRVHGDDFLPLVREWFASTGTATNLLGELRVLPPREVRPVPAAAPGSTNVMEPDSPTVRNRSHPAGESGVGPRVAASRAGQADNDSAWCGCPEEDLRPDLLYCAAHRPRFGSFPKLRHDRRGSNPAAAPFFAAAAGQTAAGVSRS